MVSRIVWGMSMFFILAGATSVQVGAIDWVWVDDDYHAGTPGWQVDHFDKVQDGISAVAAGGTVLVHEGAYTENLSFQGKAITVRSSEPNNWEVVKNTVINGNQNGSCVVFNQNETSNSVLEGFKIINGSGNFIFGYGYAGGGIYCEYSSPIIRHCMIMGNRAEIGGGIECYGGAPRIDNCIIIDNKLIDSGNGIWGGGGIDCYSYADCQISFCLISGNQAAFGGGIDCEFGSTATIDACFISGNHAVDGGGGIECGGNDPLSEIIVTNTIISGNWTDYYGGGLECYDGSSAVLVNCNITDNAALYGPALSCDAYWLEAGTAALTNGIIWNNSGGTNEYGIWNNNNSDIAIIYSIVQDANSVDELVYNQDPNNLDDDPNYIMYGPLAITGSWSAASSYDPVIKRTTFYDSLANFAPGALFGRLLDPDISQHRQAFIIDNTATTIMVEGNLIGVVSAGAVYRVVDYRLPTYSPGIDTGTELGAPTTDIRGLGRPFDVFGRGAEGTGTEFDLGAYEYLSEQLPQPGMPVLTGESDTGRYNNDNITKLNNRDPNLALRFSVNGTIIGATIDLFIDSHKVASLVATDTVTILTTDGVYLLSDGPHVVTARQSHYLYLASDMSAPLTITVDTMPPLITNPDVAPKGWRLVGQMYAFDVRAVDERSGIDNIFNQKIVMYNGSHLVTINMQSTGGDYYHGSWDSGRAYIRGWPIGQTTVHFQMKDIAGNMQVLVYDDKIKLTWPGDFEPDGDLDIVDLSVLAQEWLGAGVADIAPGGGDGVVNMFDLAELSKHWLEGTSP